MNPLGTAWAEGGAEGRWEAGAGGAREPVLRLLFAGPSAHRSAAPEAASPAARGAWGWGVTRGLAVRTWGLQRVGRGGLRREQLEEAAFACSPARRLAASSALSRSPDA